MPQRSPPSKQARTRSDTPTPRNTGGKSRNLANAPSKKDLVALHSPIPSDFSPKSHLLQRTGNSKATYVYRTRAGHILSTDNTEDAKDLHKLSLRRDMPFPVWTDVWVSLDDHKYSGWGRHNGHLIRKYTQVYEREQNEAKHCDIVPFVKALPDILKHCRKLMEAYIRKDKKVKDAVVTRDEIIAALFVIMFQCAFRIGSKKPSDESDSARGILYVLASHSKGSTINTIFAPSTTGIFL